MSRSASRSSDLAAQERLVVGLVRGVHGLRGAVRVEVLTDRPEERFRVGTVIHREGSGAALTIASAEPVADGPGWRLMFREVPDRTVAENLRGAYLEAVVDPAKALGRGQYFWHEVIGTEVRGIDGVQLGKVHDLYRIGETEVLVVRGGPHAEFDVPVVRSFIRVFAPRRGEIVVDAVALDLGAPPGAPDPDEIRPRAPRRRTRRSRAPRPETVGEAQPVTTLDGLTHGGRADPGSTVAEPDLPDQAG